MSPLFGVSTQSGSLTEALPCPASPHPHETANSPRQERHALVEEEIGKLVQRVFLLPGAMQIPEAVAFCGVEEGAGCSWVCARVGEAFAGMVSGRVCMVDLNLRSPSLHAQFRLEKGTGVAEWLKSSRPVREFVRPARVNNLWLITAGGLGLEPGCDLNRLQLRARFSDLRSEFDYLLVDTPPASSCAEAPFLCQLVDGVVLVVGARSTRRERARAAKESLETARVPILGAVLNRRTYPMPEALYRRL
ncbi:MAG: hypothetical protein ACRD4Q_12090 [Candidatus Acidiferrales bacterium]